jgi:hypothetical protein
MRPLIVVFVLFAGCAEEARDLPADSHSLSATPVHGRLLITPGELTIDSTQHSGSRSVEVALHNDGDAPLKVVNVKTYCGCAQALPLERTTLAPGESVSLAISITPPQVGEKETRVVIETDSELTPACEIPIRMTGRRLDPPYVSHVPGQIEMRATQAAGHAEATFIVHTVERAGSDFWLIGMESSDATVQATILGDPVEEQSVDNTVLRHYTIVVAAQAPGSAMEKVNARLLPVVAGESSRHIPQIAVTLELDPPVRAVPEVLYINLEQEEAFPIVRRLIFRSSDGAEWDVEIPQGLPEWISVERRTSEQSARLVQLSVVISDSVLLGDGDESVQLTFSCTHPDCPIVSVPMRITHAAPQ